MVEIETDPLTPQVNLHYGGFLHEQDRVLNIGVRHRTEKDSISPYSCLVIGCVSFYISPAQFRKIQSDFAALARRPEDQSMADTTLAPCVGGGGGGPRSCDDEVL
jgi:hypothetical protein